VKNLHSLTFRILCILALFGLLAFPAVSFASPASQNDSPEGEKSPLEVPAEIRAQFEGGISIEDFLVLNQGAIPKALEPYADVEVAILVEMEAEPLAAQYVAQREGNAPMSANAQQAYHSTLLGAQAPVAEQIQSTGGRVISQYTKAYNGLLVRVPARQIAEIRQMPGVEAVHRAPLFVPTLAKSVEHIRATQVIEELGIDGTGTTIAIVDTGVDYTHAAFGGPGTPEAYAENDPTVIEEGTFPTEKVIGGFDFAGSNYDASSDDPAQNTPNPDPDPLDVDGHGTHVASIAAGFEVPGELGHGVAPGALIYALKVFGDVAGSTNLYVDAVEWSLDPNQDNDLSDHVDVINMSLGSAYGIASLLDPGIVAVEYAVQVGVVVVASAGNNGDVSYITGDPAVADSAISVAASTTGFVTGPTITVPESVEAPRHQIVYAPAGFDENTGQFTDSVSAPITYVGNLFEDDLLCTVPDEATGTTPLEGQIALIQRGTCTFTEKVNNAASLGAVAAIVFNHEEGGNNLVTMGGPPVNIPAGFVAREDGLILVEAHGETVTISAESDAITVEDPYRPADTIAEFSSRGPRSLDAFQKPDVTAPGVSIFAAKAGSGSEGTAISGTSMSSPHVAGVAALVIQDHPDWSPEQVKAAIMNTAVDLQAGSAEVPRQGAGRVDAYRAVTTDALAIGEDDRISLSWGITQFSEDFYQDTKLAVLHDLSGESGTYQVSVVWGENSLTEGVTITVPETLEVTESDRLVTFEINLTIDASQVPVDFLNLEEYYGNIVLSKGEGPEDDLRIPFYLIPQPYSQLLITDVDFRGGLRQIEIEVTHSGPVPSRLWVYPLYENDENELDQEDMADLRLVGMDAGFSDPDFGEIFIPAINVHGSWFTPQPYFAEFDLYLDTNEDGSPDFIDFNWNAGAVFGTGDDDVWIVVQFDVAAGVLTLGSPYLIYTDYNSGFMEWYLPATWNGLEPGTDTDFNWQLLAWDALANLDVSGEHYFDIAYPPFTWEIDSNPGPEDPTANIRVRASNPRGIFRTNPIGLMLVDYNGRPGEGQAYPILFP
jgi:minor extracellular serine protease Vpr